MSRSSLRFSALALVALALVALALPCLAHAQDNPYGRVGPATRAVHFGIAGGAAVPTGDFKDRFKSGALQRDIKTGFQAQGFVDVHPAGLPIGFRATASYNRFGIQNVQYGATGLPVTSGTSTSSASSPVDGYSQILGGLGNVTIELPTGPIRPYVIAGLGAFNVKNVIENLSATQSTLAGAGTSGEASASSTNLGVDGGAGIKFAFGGMQAFIEGRVSNVYTSKEKFGTLKSVTYVPVTFGFLF